MLKNKPFEVVSSRIAWYRIRQDEIITPNGKPGIYNVVEKEPAVWVVPVTHDRQIVLINHYRHTVDDWCFEVPAGSVKVGQTIEEAASEELREEIGGRGAKLDYIGQFYPADGICNEIGHIFLATDVILGEPEHEPAEIIEIQLKSITEVIGMAKSNEIADGPSALAILLCAARLETITLSS